MKSHETNFNDFGRIGPNYKLHLSLHLLKVIVEAINILIGFCDFLDFLLNGSAVVFGWLISVCIRAWNLGDWKSLLRLSLDNLSYDGIYDVNEVLADD